MGRGELRISRGEVGILDSIVGKAFISEDFADKLLDRNQRREILSESGLSGHSVEYLCSLNDDDLTSFVNHIHSAVILSDENDV